MINIIDDILLFKPDVKTGGEIYRYEEISKVKINRYSPIVCFYTADIDSILYIADKMMLVAIHFNPLVIVLRGGDRKKILTIIDVYLLNLRKRIQSRYFAELADKVTKDVSRLSTKKKNFSNDRSEVPVYIKTTMCFGIQSGGAVAHSVGVLSALKKIYRKVAVYTTDFIPENIVDDDVDEISMEGFWDFYDEAKLFLNFSAYNEIVSKESTRPLFVYQRCSLYDYLGVKVSVRFKVPLVLEWNGSEIWVSKNWDDRGFKYRKLAEKIERLDLEKADLITCVSDELKRDLVKNGVSADKILVNYNGVDVNKFNPDVNGKAIRNKLGIDGTTVIGFCGSFAKFHGAEVLAEAFGNISGQKGEYASSFSLLMIGEGNTLPDVKRILKRKGAMNKARCVGTVDFNDVPRYLAACDILIAPHIKNDDGSEFFGSPTKLFEYMAMGKPIIASELNQIGEILSDGYSAVMTEPGSVKDLEDSIINLAANKELMIEIGRNAREEAVKNHSWDKHVDNIIFRLKEMKLL